MATMDRIYHWRTKAREVEHSLQAAYESDLPPGTTVAYLQGKNQVIVEIVQGWGPHRCKVRNAANDKTYLLDYARIDGIVVP